MYFVLGYCAMFYGDAKSKQYKIYSIKCTVYNTRYIMHSIQSTENNTLYTIHSIQYILYNSHKIHTIQYTVYNKRYTMKVYNFQN